MGATLELTPEKAKKRISQANEMAAIWEESDVSVQMYLKGCIVTAKALSDRCRRHRNEGGNGIVEQEEI